MPLTYVRHAILVVALLLGALAARASNEPTPPAPMSSPLADASSDAGLFLPQLREAALQYVEPARPIATPGRETPTVYPLHWAAVTDRAETARKLIDQGI